MSLNETLYAEHVCSLYTLYIVHYTMNTRYQLFVRNELAELAGLDEWMDGCSYFRALTKC